MDPILGAALVSGGSQIVQTGGNFLSDLLNRNYNRQLQQQIFNREDTAVQRRAADLEAAGLSKTLAAGGGANAGQAIKLEAPHLQGNPVEAAIAGAAAAQGIAKTRAEVEYLRSQKEKVDTEKQGQDLQNKLLADQASYSSATLAWRIEQADYDTLTKWYKTLESESDSVRARLKIGEQEHENLKRALENEMLSKYGMTKLQAEVAAAQAIADYSRYESDRYRDAGTVKGGVLPSALTSWLAEFNKLMNQLKLQLGGSQ